MANDSASIGVRRPIMVSGGAFLRPFLVLGRSSHSRSFFFFPPTLFFFDHWGPLRSAAAFLPLRSRKAIAQYLHQLLRNAQNRVLAPVLQLGVSKAELSISQAAVPVDLPSAHHEAQTHGRIDLGGG
jgi:ribosomal protein L22